MSRLEVRHGNAGPEGGPIRETMGMWRKRKKLSVVVSIAFLSVTGVVAEEFELNWSTIDAGGGSSAGETYRIGGTIGQPDAWNASSNGYQLTGGFWDGIGEEDTGTPTPTFTPKATSTFGPTETPTGTMIPLTPTSTGTQVVPTPTATPIPGDTNADGLVDERDAFFFFQWWQESVNDANLRCDVVRDDRIDEKDLLQLMRHWK